jgi:hypothetical protein
LENLSQNMDYIFEDGMFTMNQKTWEIVYFQSEGKVYNNFSSKKKSGRVNIKVSKNNTSVPNTLNTKSSVPNKNLGDADDEETSSEYDEQFIYFYFDGTLNSENLPYEVSPHFEGNSLGKLKGWPLYYLDHVMHKILQTLPKTNAFFLPNDFLCPHKYGDNYEEKIGRRYEAGLDEDVDQENPSEKNEKKPQENEHIFYDGVKGQNSQEILQKFLQISNLEATYIVKQLRNIILEFTKKCQWKLPAVVEAEVTLDKKGEEKERYSDEREETIEEKLFFAAKKQKSP